jgi:gamma-glutamylcyclotransferase (GGCT)/AIG2-like uncharacterized protein YtfP
MERREMILKPADSTRITENNRLSGEWPAVGDTDLLFVYGTLRRTAGGMHSLLGRAVFLGGATWPGRLYRVDGYPGAVASREPGATIRGELYRLVDPEETLAILDDYEECGPAFGPESEYRRLVTRVTRTDGTQVPAWIYLYNRPVDGLELIASGDFS